MNRLRPGVLAGLPLLLLLGACLDRYPGDIDFAPYGRTDPIGAPDSLTVRRVMGTPTEVPPLNPEPGNVWPAEEAPRATLQNPEAATVPPGERQRSEGLENARRQRGGATPEGGFAPSSTQPGYGAPPEAAPNPRAPAPGTRRRGSTDAPPPPLDIPPVPRAGVPQGEPAVPPPSRTDQSLLPVPGGPPASITGAPGGVQTYVQPGVGAGTAIQQGGTTTLIGPNGAVQVVPNR